MNAEKFTYWLQGFVELCPTGVPSEAQWSAIKDHLQLVFLKVTPTCTPNPPPSLKPSTPIYPPMYRTLELRPSDMPLWEPKITCSIPHTTEYVGDLAKATIC